MYIKTYKNHSREPENVAFMSSLPFIYRYNYIHYSLMGKMRLPFIDSDLLYRGTLIGRFDSIQHFYFKL